MARACSYWQGVCLFEMCQVTQLDDGKSSVYNTKSPSFSSVLKKEGCYYEKRSLKIKWKMANSH